MKVAQTTHRTSHSPSLCLICFPILVSPTCLHTTFSMCGLFGYSIFLYYLTQFFQRAPHFLSLTPLSPSFFTAIQWVTPYWMKLFWCETYFLWFCPRWRLPRRTHFFLWTGSPFMVVGFSNLSFFRHHQG